MQSSSLCHVWICVAGSLRVCPMNPKDQSLCATVSVVSVHPSPLPYFPILCLRRGEYLLLELDLFLAFSLCVCLCACLPPSSDSVSE